VDPLAAPRIVAIGEGMIELAGGLGSRARLGHGGDVLNVAIALARLGFPPAFVTALGRDPWSDELAGLWRDEGLDTSLIARHPDRGPGLYGITLDAAGERSFTYWRDRSAARDLFALPEADALMARAAQADLLFLSGITLSLFDDAGRDRIGATAAAVRARGGIVAFDANYRPRGWTDAATARAAYARFAPQVTLALPTAEDEAAMHDERFTPAAIADRWHRLGATDVVVKLGAMGALVSTPAGATLVPTERIAPVDTSGAGDAFDAGYLAGRLSGRSPVEAARLGHRVAGSTIAHPGAIPPRNAITPLAPGVKPGEDA
jgi:2-dehydro-3-deoxygluconokinase